MAQVPDVYGDDDALRPEHLRQPPDQTGALDGGGVDRDLVGAAAEREPRIAHRPDAAPDGERDVKVRGHLPDERPQGRPLLEAGRYVQEDDLVRPLVPVPL